MGNGRRGQGLPAAMPPASLTQPLWSDAAMIPKIIHYIWYKVARLLPMPGSKALVRTSYQWG